MRLALRKIWSAIREVTGDDAYERYLAHWRAQHSADTRPLDRSSFYRDEQRRKWSGIRRCC